MPDPGLGGLARDPLDSLLAKIPCLLREALAVFSSPARQGQLLLTLARLLCLHCSSWAALLSCADVSPRRFDGNFSHEQKTRSFR